LSKLIAPVRSPTKFSPLFVLAPARSYTSVISMMLGQHPGLVALPELKLFSYRTIGELEASLPRFWRERGVTHRSPGLVRALAEFEFGDQSLDSLGRAREWLHERLHWSGPDVLDTLLERLSPRLCVEKSPENVETDAALERLAAAYPNARYLHLTRHPVTTQRSIQNHLQRTVPGYPQDDQPMSGIAAWYAAHRRILMFTATLPNDRYLRVKAEDTLNDMRPHLRAIATWLGLRTDADAIESMTHPELSPFAGFGPAGSGVSGGNDPTFLRDPKPRTVAVPSTLEEPPGWSETALVWQMVVDLANRLGYP
jgi:Sulfotransferase family